MLMQSMGSYAAKVLSIKYQPFPALFLELISEMQAQAMERERLMDSPDHCSVSRAYSPFLGLLYCTCVPSKITADHGIKVDGEARRVAAQETHPPLLRVFWQFTWCKVGVEATIAFCILRDSNHQL